MLQRIIQIKQQLAQTSDKQERMTLLHELGWEYALREMANDLSEILLKTRDMLKGDFLDSTLIASQELLEAYEKMFAKGYASALEDAIRISQKWSAILSDNWHWRLYFLTGWIHSHTGNFDEAMTAYRSLYDLAEKIDDGIGICRGLTGIGVVYGYLDDLDNAEDYFQKALLKAQEIADLPVIFLSNFNLCQVYIYKKDLIKASIHANQTIELAQQKGDERDIANATSRLALVYIEQEQYENAESILSERLQQIPDTREMLFSRLQLLRLLGKTYTLHEKYHQAIEQYIVAIERARQVDNSLTVLESLEDLVTAYEHIGDHKQALAHHKDYLALYKKFHSETNLEKIRVLETVYRTREAEQQLIHQKAITDKAIKQAEQDKQYFEELNRMKTAFIDSATHDLKNPLTGIRLNAQMLRRKIDPQYHRFLDRIETDSQRMNALIADMLDVAKLETRKALNLRLNALGQVVKEAIDEYRLFAEEKQIKIQTVLPDHEIYFYFDDRYIFRCLSNLLSNAIKYSNEESQVAIRVTEMPEILQIEVEDQGAGIPEQDVAHIFERFYRAPAHMKTNIEGTGLGLAIVQSIVEQHNGTITVTSTAGKGTTFTIQLPYHREASSFSNAG